MTVIYTTGSSGTIGKHLPTGVRSIALDLSSENQKFTTLGFETNSNLLHLGGVVGPSEVLNDVEYARSVNIRGTSLLAQEFRRKSSGVFYFISTSHVYAPSSNLISEEAALAPSNLYAKQKLEAEALLQDIFELEPRRLCIVRVFSVLDWDVAAHTLGGALRKVVQLDPDFKLSNCSDVRDFLTPKSVALALSEIAAANTQSNVLNLCSGVGISVGEAARRMLSESGFEIPEEKFLWGQSTNPYLVGDNSRLLSLHPTLKLTWHPSPLIPGGNNHPLR
jgi:nucleoside-diphosphate-sugar epimerase